MDQEQVSLSNAKMNGPVEEIVDPVFDFMKNKKPVANYSFSEYELAEYLPDNNDSISSANVNPIYIRSKDKHSYLLFQDSYLVVKVQVTNSLGNAVEDLGTNVVIANLTNLFSRCIYLIDESEKTDVNNWHIARHIKVLTEKGKHYDTYGTSEYYYPDDYQIFSTPGGSFDSKYNQIRTLKEVAVKIPLKALTPLMEGWKKVSIGTEHVIQLERNVNTSVLYQIKGAGGDDNDAQFKITGLKWYVPKVTPSPKARLMIDQFLSTGKSFNIGFCNYNVYPSRDITLSKTDDGNNNPSRTTEEIVVNTTTYKPSQVYVVLQRKDAHSNINVNGSLFGGFHLATDGDLDGADTLNDIITPRLHRANIKVNGERLMRNEFITETGTISNFYNANNALQVQGDWQKLYESYVKYKNKDKTGDGCLLSYDDFAKKAVIIRFDLTKMDRSVFESRNTTDLVLELVLSADFSDANHPESIVATAYTMVCSDRVMSVNFQDGKLLFEDSSKQPL